MTHFLSFYLVKNFSKLPPFPFAFVVLSDFSLSVLPHCSIRRVHLCLFLPSHVSLWDVPRLLVSPCPSPGQVGTLLSLDWQPRLSFGLWRTCFLLKFGSSWFLWICSFLLQTQKSVVFILFYFVQVKILLPCDQRPFMCILIGNGSVMRNFKDNTRKYGVPQRVLLILVGFAQWKALADNQCPNHMLSDILLIFLFSKTKIGDTHAILMSHH